MKWEQVAVFCGFFVPSMVAAEWLHIRAKVERYPASSFVVAGAGTVIGAFVAWPV